MKKSTDSKSGRSSDATDTRPSETGEASADPASVPVVGIGASAGGLEALKQLFDDLPADSGMAFVVIQHLDPERPSMLTSVLAEIAGVPVVEATNGMPVKPNRIHVIPSDADITIQHGMLKIGPRQLTGRLHLPIDSFFQSLAEDRGNHAIGVVLSGSGADGTEGLKAIKSEGGIAIAQEPDSAQFRDMPESALAAGVVDFLGTPEQIAAELERLGDHPYMAVPSHDDAEPPVSVSDQEKSLDAVYALVGRHAGLDFRGYKQNTVLRRIKRRMAIRRIGELDKYTAVLRDEPDEARALAKDMLIHVTSFFRDPDAFTALQQRVFSEFTQDKRAGDSIRIWVPGCSTGEEVYSLAICLLDTLGTAAEGLTITLFGTDLSEESIETARIGLYPDTAVTGVKPDWLSRFFDHRSNGYQIAKHVRDLCVFVKHDLTVDPPFARLDLISCRNVLIYFDAELQRRVIPMMHHCLNKEGYLFLGQSESITGFRDLFAPVDKEYRIFTKTGASPPLVYPRAATRETEGKLSESRLPMHREPAREAERQADHLLLARFAPPGVLVNDRLEVIQFRGRTGAYLEQPPGQPQANLLRMARENLVAHIHEAIEQAKADTIAVRKEGLQIQDGDRTRILDLEVVPLPVMPDSTEHYFLILFNQPRTHTAESRKDTSRPAPSEPSNDTVTEIDRLKADLVATRDYLQSVISDHQTTTDELAATNEEIIAANEELLSTNEELQSAKEELQSTNEELSTVNDELQNRNRDLDQLANDLVNVLSSVQIPVIIVDLELRIRRFTPAIDEIANFIPEDEGRPIDDLKLNLRIDDLAGRIRGVIDHISARQWEVQTQTGRWFRMDIRPYLTVDQRLDGAVLSFVDVDVLKHARKEAERARDYAKKIVETVTTALVVLDSSLRMRSANTAFLQTFSVSAREIEGKPLFDLDADLWKLPAIQRTLQESFTRQSELSGFEVTTELPRLGRRVLSLTGRPFSWDHDESMMLLAVDDITELRELEAERALLLASEKQARLEAERANDAKDVFLATLSHELRTPLSTILMSAQLLKQLPTTDPAIARASTAIERATQAQSRLIDDLLDISRVVSGKLLLDLGPVDFEGVVQNAVDIAKPAAEAKSLELDVVVDGTIDPVYGDEVRLQQVVNNLLTNAIKFTPQGGHVSVQLGRDEDDRILLTVTDTGIGIPPDVLPRLFNRFVQADSSVTRTYGGLGLGLSIVRYLVEAHGGSVQVDSPGEGEGATFRIMLPPGDAETSQPIAASQMSAQTIEGVRVLLVEDDDDTRETYAAMLTKHGAEVQAAPSAAAGFLAFQKARPQVILSDIAMPGEDGFSFIQRVRRLPPDQGGEVPAAALTALASPPERQRALEAGFQLHATKPMDAAELISVVNALVNWPSPPASESDSD